MTTGEWIATAGMGLPMIGALLGFIARGRAGRREHLNALAEPLERVLRDARELLGTIVATGGMDAPDMARQWRPIAELLETSAAGLDLLDEKLARAVDATATGGKRAWQSSPGTARSAKHEQIIRHTDGAREGRDAATTALKRLSAMRAGERPRPSRRRHRTNRGT